LELNAAIQLFLTNYFQKKRLSEKTYQLYKNELDKFQQFLHSINPLCLIENVDEKLIDYYLIECSKNLPLAKLANIASHLRSFFGFLKKEQVITNDPSLFLQNLPIGTILKFEDTFNFLSDLNKNLKKLGKEQYKFQAVFESRKDRESEFFNELKRRINRSERLLEEVVKFKNELESKISLDFIKELLPVVDGLEEAIDQISSLSTVGNSGQKGFMKKIFSSNITPPDLDQWQNGLSMIHDRLIQLLNKVNVTQIKSLGEKFNPYKHIATSVDEKKDVEDNTIIKEDLKGYYQGTEVIRLAEVVVSRKKKWDNVT
jgi:molecular chaperone GrpE